MLFIINRFATSGFRNSGFAMACLGEDFGHANVEMAVEYFQERVGNEAKKLGNEITQVQGLGNSSAKP